MNTSSRGRAVIRRERLKEEGVYLLFLIYRRRLLEELRYIGMDSIKTTSLEEMSEIRLAIALGISLIIEGG